MLRVELSAHYQNCANSNLWIPGLENRPTPLNDAYQDDDDGYNEKDMDESSQSVGSYESQEPQDQQDYR